MKFIKSIKDRNDKVWAKFYDPKTKISKQGKWYSIFPTAIILLGVLLICIPAVGLNLGLDFTGGSVVNATNIVNQERVTEARSQVESFLRSEGITFETSTPVSNDGSLGLTIKYQGGTEETSNRIVNIINGVCDTANVLEAETISPSASAERVMMTFISIAVSLIAILVYMLFRFKFTSGVAAVIGLMHDVLVAIALCAIFQVQINYPFVAAIITVVVYSLNNTIVLFDRIRSKEKAMAAGGIKRPVEDIVDESVKETFARTMGTTVTTLIPVLVLCMLPVPLIREFALPIFFGLVAGTFSTIFVTTALYVRFEKYNIFRKKYKSKIQRKENLVSAEM